MIRCGDIRGARHGMLMFECFDFPMLKDLYDERFFVDRIGRVVVIGEVFGDQRSLPCRRIEAGHGGYGGFNEIGLLWLFVFLLTEFGHDTRKSAVLRPVIDQRRR